MNKDIFPSSFLVCILLWFFCGFFGLTARPVPRLVQGQVQTCLASLLVLEVSVQSVTMNSDTVTE